jgi:hypothetical protein
MYEELIESFQYIITDLFDYARTNHIDLPHAKRVYRNIDKVRELIEYRIEKCIRDESRSSDDSIQRDNNETTDDKYTEPKIAKLL